MASLACNARLCIAAAKRYGALPRLPTNTRHCAAYFSSESASTPARRSVLFVPAKEKMLRKAQAGFGADAVILDLEDAVAVGEKDNARSILKNVLKHNTSDWGGAEVIVRVNSLETQCVADCCGIRPLFHRRHRLQMGSTGPGSPGRSTWNFVIHGAQD